MSIAQSLTDHYTPFLIDQNNELLSTMAIKNRPPARRGGNRFEALKREKETIAKKVDDCQDPLLKLVNTFLNTPGPAAKSQLTSPQGIVGYWYSFIDPQLKFWAQTPSESATAAWYGLRAQGFRVDSIKLDGAFVADYGTELFFKVMNEDKEYFQFRRRNGHSIAIPTAKFMDIFLTNRDSAEKIFVDASGRLGAAMSFWMLAKDLYENKFSFKDTFFGIGAFPKTLQDLLEYDERKSTKDTTLKDTLFIQKEENKFIFNTNENREKTLEKSIKSIKTIFIDFLQTHKFLKAPKGIDKKLEILDKKIEENVQEIKKLNKSTGFVYSHSFISDSQCLADTYTEDMDNALKLLNSVPEELKNNICSQIIELKNQINESIHKINSLSTDTFITPLKIIESTPEQEPYFISYKNIQNLATHIETKTKMDQLIQDCAESQKELESVGHRVKECSNRAKAIKNAFEKEQAKEEEAAKTATLEQEVLDANAEIRKRKGKRKAKK